MAEININVLSIHAKIKGSNNIIMMSDDSIVIDPLTNSYSNLGTLTLYDLDIENKVDITEEILLKNGKNSRFSACGPGTCDIKLTIYDSNGNQDTDIITITII